MGCLVDLWHDSQALEVSDATYEELHFWLGTLDEEKTKALISAFEAVDLLRKNDLGGWEISGNAKHIRNLRKHRKNARNNGKKGGRPKITQNETDVGSQNITQPKTSVQYSSVQFSTAQNSTGRDTKISPREIEECTEVWGRTLSRYKIQKDPKLDQTEIARLIQTHGFEKTKLALLGAGFEEESNNYKPAKHVAIRRLWKPDLFDTFVNLGAQHRPTARQVYDPSLGGYRDA